ncbi:MAG: acetyl-CoA carboxylase biotin carboxylase subunit [Deltaproteobacteria bacterium]|nr:acetyl-CoA carboxylase biotin carboxylase subunit [Deltaproteobacteria bacterium]
MSGFFKKILIANRGEIAVRIIRACKELGIKTVAVYSTADSDSLHIKLADESVCIGGPFPRESYLNVMAIISAAKLTGCDALHPGYGFLSEKQVLPELCQELGITFIGPRSDVIKELGDKDKAKQLAKKTGIPTVPGAESGVENVEEAYDIACSIGFPVLIKAVAGGGGRGMRIVYEKSEFKEQFSNAQQEVLSAFGDPNVLVEKYIPRAKHIEVQILGDLHGNYVHFGLRECSVQRRFQKIIEEALPHLVSREIQETVARDALKLVRSLGYHCLGTVEFIYDCDDQKHYFLEVNTRIQVEHPITEEITGRDLVKLQIMAGAGAKLPLSQKDITFNGHAIELRVNAEDSVNLLPQSGKVHFYHQPSGFGVRVDSCLFSGAFVSPYYDSLLGKIILWAEDRDQCLKKALWALNEMAVVGVETNQKFIEKILCNEEFVRGTYTTTLVDNLLSGIES